MSRKIGASKKSEWQNLSPWLQFEAFLEGKSFTKNIQADGFALRFYALIKWADSMTKEERNAIQIFAPSKEDSIERDTQGAMAELFHLVAGCQKKGDATELRDIADAIEAGARPVKPAVDPERAWLWRRFHPYKYGYERPLRLDESFSEIREAAFDEFENGIDDKTLRGYLGDFRFIPMREKTGPKGTRTKRE